MIRVTIWNENVQERGDVLGPVLYPDDSAEHQARRERMQKGAQEIRAVHPSGIHGTLGEIISEEQDVQVKLVTLDMDNAGITDALLAETDVLVWWAHVAHDKVPDAVAELINEHVLRGMGFIALHSAHLCKPLRRLLGTSCTLHWRDGDVSRVWNTAPTHPITQGVPEYIELEEEEMYGEFFDIPKPDDQVFISWFSGGEVFRSGCTWTRGYGKVFFFQPGHETNRSYHNPHVRRILKNAVRWAAPTLRRDALDCPHAVESPEMKRLSKG